MTSPAASALRKWIHKTFRYSEGGCHLTDKAKNDGIAVYIMKPVLHRSGKVLRMNVEIRITKKGMDFLKRTLPVRPTSETRH
ncbi:MAG: hypothetical protein ACJ8AI_27550 [Rhodopila sp.]